MQPTLVFKDYADHTSFETFADLIDQISCEVYYIRSYLVLSNI